MNKDYKHIIQIINAKNPDNFLLEKLKWIESFERDRKKNYEHPEFATLEVLYGSNILRLDANLYIKPISIHKINVGFRVGTKPQLLPIESLSSVIRPVHWVTITDESEPKTDVLSKFLLLILGILCLGTSTDIHDLQYTLAHGRNGRIINLSETPQHIRNDALSAIAWVNLIGKMQLAFNQSCNTIGAYLQSTENTSFINMSFHDELKDTRLALLVSH